MLIKNDLIPASQQSNTNLIDYLKLQFLDNKWLGEQYALFKDYAGNPFYLSAMEQKIRLYNKVCTELLTQKPSEPLLKFKSLTETLMSQIDAKKAKGHSNNLVSQNQLISKAKLDREGNIDLDSIPQIYFPTKKDMLSEIDFLCPSERGDGRNEVYAKIGKYYVFFQPGGKGSYKAAIYEINADTKTLNEIWSAEKGRYSHSFELDELLPFELDAFYSGMTLYPSKEKHLRLMMEHGLRMEQSQVLAIIKLTPEEHFAKCFKELVTAALLDDTAKLNSAINCFNQAKAQGLLTPVLSGEIENMIQLLAPKFSLPKETRHHQFFQNHSMTMAAQSSPASTTVQTIKPINSASSQNVASSLVPATTTFTQSALAKASLFSTSNTATSFSRSAPSMDNTTLTFHKTKELLVVNQLISSNEQVIQRPFVDRKGATEQQLRIYSSDVQGLKIKAGLLKQHFNITGKSKEPKYVHYDPAEKKYFLVLIEKECEALNKRLSGLEASVQLSSSLRM